MERQGRKEGKGSEGERQLYRYQENLFLCLLTINIMYEGEAGLSEYREEYPGRWIAVAGGRAGAFAPPRRGVGRAAKQASPAKACPQTERLNKAPEGAV